MSSESSLSSIGEMIDTAFGDIDKNIVDFNLLQAVLFILGSKLHVLQRRVQVELHIPFMTPSSTTISVTEIKVHAKMRKKKKKVGEADTTEDGAKIHKKIERPIQKTVQAYHMNVARKTSGSRVKKEPFTLGHKFAPGKSKTDPSSSILSNKSSTSRLGVKKSLEKTPEKFKPKEKLSLESTSAKYELERDSKKHGEQDVTKILSDESSTDTLVSTSISSQTTGTDVCRPSGSSISLEKEEKVTFDVPESEDDFKSLLWTWDEPGEIIQESIIIGATSSSAIEPSTVVTAKQFDGLVKAVIQLQSKYGNIDIPGITDNPLFMDLLRQNAYMSEGSGGLQLSARLEIAEMVLQKLKTLVQIIFDQMQKGGKEKYQRRPEPGEELSLDQARALSEDLDAELLETPGVAKPTSAQSKLASRAITVASRKQPTILEEGTTQSLPLPPRTFLPTDHITYEDLDVALAEIYEEYMKKISIADMDCRKLTTRAMNQIRVIDVQVTKALDDLTTQMVNMEKVITDYADKINAIDMTLSTNMTNYQDELTQMQYDLESGLDVMVEAIANQTGDAEGVAEMNFKFNNLKADLETTDASQKELNGIQDFTSMEIKGLKKVIADLKEAKCDRDEVADALTGKANISALNGMVYLYQFNAVHGDMEKRIVDTYDKINHTELAWQKSINELTKQFMARAEKVQVETFRIDVNKNLQNLKVRLQFISDILGEVKPHKIVKNIFHNETCLSCDLPGMEEPILKPIPPAFLTSKQSKNPSQFGDHRICYPGGPLPHPRDPRSHVLTCTKYCGGPSNNLERESVSMAFSTVPMDPAIAAGDDANVTVTHSTQKPCLPCNRPRILRPSIKSMIKFGEEAEDDDSAMCPSYCSCKGGQERPPAAPME